jgi:small subunit ribosomal protein S1
MKKISDKNDLIKPPKVGEIIEGKVIGEKRQALFLDLGNIGAGIIYGKEFQEAKEELKNLKIGDSVFAKIIDLENELGYIELSVSQASNELIWEGLKQKKEEGEIIVVKISGANRGGLLTEVSGISAFLPVSQLLPEHYPRVEGGDSSKILKELQKFVGEKLEVKIFDLSPREKKLILSEKVKEVEKIKEVLKKYKVGEVLEGEITGITDFGVFLKFGSENLEGLIHISELDWAIVEDPAEIVKVGEKLKVKIIDISDDKVSLSLKALKKDPWKDIEKKYKKGETVSGKVTKFNPFGAFVQITPKIQGLCHISEFGTKTRMAERLKIDGKYDFQILEIRPEEHRMTLKLVEK